MAWTKKCAATALADGCAWPDEYTHKATEQDRQISNTNCALNFYSEVGSRIWHLLPESYIFMCNVLN
jgi:hypothetical protein